MDEPETLLGHPNLGPSAASLTCRLRRSSSFSCEREPGTLVDSLRHSFTYDLDESTHDSNTLGSRNILTSVLRDLGSKVMSSARCFNQKAPEDGGPPLFQHGTVVFQGHFPHASV
jgi:hypothetical protein